MKTVAKIDTDAVRRLWDEGMTDTQIAEQLGWCRETVRKNRRMLGLPPAVSHRDVIHRLMAGGLLRDRNEALAARRSCLAAAYGLPADTHPTQVVILVTLASVPLTAEGLADAIGRPTGRKSHYHRFLCPKVLGGNHLTALRRNGLVELFRPERGAGGGSGRAPALYLLTPLAMDMMAGMRNAQEAGNAQNR